MSSSSLNQLTTMLTNESHDQSKRQRASGDILDYLLLEFKQNANPPPEIRKVISEKTGMSERSVRIWFQNRRAKVRKLEKLQHDRSNSFGSSASNSVLNTPTSFNNGFEPNDYFHKEDSQLSISSISALPIDLNEKYCFTDCSSLSVGTWQRVRTGYHSTTLLTSLVNLSPMTINNVMTTSDLLIILSKKNHEINYFFSAIANNDRILFRIFYPISNILSCSLVDNTLNSSSNIELRLSLSNPPKFAVFFMNGTNSQSNQWSICDDFSEDQQVNAAHSGDGGTAIPHVLVGSRNSLQFLNSFILDASRNNLQVAENPIPDTNPIDPSQLESNSIDQFDQDFQTANDQDFQQTDNFTQQPNIADDVAMMSDLQPQLSDHQFLLSPVGHFPDLTTTVSSSHDKHFQDFENEFFTSPINPSNEFLQSPNPDQTPSQLTPHQPSTVPLDMDLINFDNSMVDFNNGTFPNM